MEKSRQAAGFKRQDYKILQCTSNRTVCLRDSTKNGFQQRAFFFEARRLKPVFQWRKWRTPVNTIASPRRSAASITSGSRCEPPG